jgi:chromate reductase, NAD(P)H dehydrogenase (quinone)
MGDLTFRLLGIAGSLRSASYNRGLLRAAAELLPEGVALSTFDIREIPVYNQDVQSTGDPPSVDDLKRRIIVADALLVATPEYNYSVPGALKNAIDWVSRPPKTCCLRKKPVGIVGASSGESGTMRAQLALRQTFVFTDSLVMAQPEFRLPGAGGKCDESGLLVDQEQRERLRAYIAALIDWARLVAPAG